MQDSSMATTKIIQEVKTTTDSPSPVSLRIKPTRGWASLKVAELWEYRELIYFFTWREVKVRYKQTILGALWAILQPLLSMLIFTLFFGRLAKIPSEGIPYPLFSYTALVPWTFFATGLTQGSNTLVQNSNMLKKVYFPRMTMPIGTVMSGCVDFCLAFVVLLGMIAFYGVVPTWRILWLPFFFLLAIVTCIGVSLWLSAMNVQFRDIRYTVPFITQFWMFATPIVYPSTLLPEPWRTLYGINPMVGVVEGFRWALLDAHTSIGPIVLMSSVVALGLLLGGAFYFRRLEKTFADV
jgi:lipopolysaccharide transport system permease protein